MSQPGAEQGNQNTDNGQNGDNTGQVTAPPQVGEQEEKFDKAYVEQLRREAAAARTANKSLQKKIDDAAHANLSETEKAIAEARKNTEVEVTKRLGARLATSEFRTQAVASGISTEQLPALLEDLAVEKFVTDDGEPDLKRIEAKVKSWASFAAPKQEERRTSFDGGPRTTSTATSMDEMIRAQVGIRAQ